MNRQLLAVPLLVAGILALGACSSPTTGSPTASTTTDNQPTGGSSTSTGGSQASGDPLASVSPCSLITQAQVTQYQLSQSGSDTENGARTCSWQGVQDGSSVGGEVDVDVYDNVGFSQLNNSGFTVTDFPLKSHQGHLEQGQGNDLCSVAIEVTSTSVINVDGQSGAGSQTASCNIAKQFAPIVEQNLIAMGH